MSMINAMSITVDIMENITEDITIPSLDLALDEEIPTAVMAVARAGAGVAVEVGAGVEAGAGVAEVAAVARFLAMMLIVYTLGQA